MAAQLSAAQADVLAASESPVALSALTAPATAAAWKTIKSYFFVGTTDNAIPAALQLDMATRTGAWSSSSRPTTSRCSRHPTR